MGPFLTSDFTVLYGVISSSKQATIKAAKEFSGRLKPGDRIALCGELGSGKTHFVKGLVSGRGGSPKEVQSPTFNIIKRYTSRGGMIYHFDFYRLGGFEELENTGYREIISDPDSITAAEWPEVVPGTWTDFNYAVIFEHCGGNKRKMTLYRRKNAAGAGRKKAGKTGKRKNL